MGALDAHPTIVATAPASTARLIAFENTMIPSYGLERRAHRKAISRTIEINFGRYAQQKQEKDALTAPGCRRFVVFVTVRSFPAPSSRSALSKNLESRQCFPFEHFEKRTATGRDISHVFLDTVFGNGCQGIPSPGNTECRRPGNGLCNGPRSIFKGCELKNTHRPVPDDGARLQELVRQAAGRGGPGVQNQGIVSQVL